MNEIDPQTGQHEARRTARHHQAITRRNRQRHRYGNARCGLTFPVYITVRNSGDALVTIATSARSVR